MKLDKTKKYAFDIPNAKISKLVQRRLFELGYSWVSHDRSPQYLNAKSLYIEDYSLYQSGTNVEDTLRYMEDDGDIIIHYSQIIGDSKFLNNFK